MFDISSHQKKFTSHYVLSEIEHRKLNEILLNSNRTEYTAFLIVLLKELDGDIGKVLRLLNVGVNGSTRVVPVALFNFLVTSIKEAIILSSYKKHLTSEGVISSWNMAKHSRFRVASIDRSTIHRTLEKYNIKHTTLSVKP